MRNEWILDVLTDLRTFAEQNGMPASADHLSDACLVVATELANIGAEAQSDRACANDAKFGKLSGTCPAS